MKIDGKQIAQNIFDDLGKQVGELRGKGIIPNLAIILVGEDPASVAYVNQKKLKAEKIGATTSIVHLMPDVSESALIETIKRFNQDRNVHGIIVQQPLPQHINVQKITQAVDPKKDVDGFHSDTQFEMPIAMAVLKILEEVYVHTFEVEPQFISWLKTKNIVVIGKGETGGKPVADALRKLGANPTIIDSRTMNPELLTREADIIISAVGKPHVLRPEMLKKGVILISIGISRGESAKLTGDYDQNEVENIASLYTPTPGGVGPVNVAMLLKNLLKAALA